MNENNPNCRIGCDGLMWWMTLLVAVIAVPSFAFIVVKTLHVQGMTEIALFMITCWVSTYLGMRLMQNPKVADKLTLKK
jgi:hypothetical protein